jgi:hypothetical protein
MFLEVSDISKKGEEHFVLSNILFSQIADISHR